MYIKTLTFLLFLVSGIWASVGFPSASYGGLGGYQKFASHYACHEYGAPYNMASYYGMPCNSVFDCNNK